MTSVIGHLNGLDFEPDYRKWTSCLPEHLFDARVIETVDTVRRYRQNAVEPRAYSTSG